MLEIKNLTKIYRSKTGDEVKALDNVSISFPETGMIFILGKSGSGKSTLLNVMGGLDSYDDGEFIIKGKSSKDFAGSDFDAYRNTFIGFIFQEYNVLDDFTVGANIGLALELQGKKATDEKINAILEQVDLLSYAKRKPNELSGGQKQRVAIARALVKEPQIIMADEPTGALDSNTGKQIFDTLKALSREKLVLIVSHDRDFAERYADRIVELSDGRILSDVTKHEKQSVHLSEGIQQINDRILRIKGGYRLTENDLQMINAYLQQNNHDIILSGDTRINDELRSAAGISAEGNTSVFEDTDAEQDITLRSYDKKESKFIRSRLPAKNALRIGSSGLKHKKFRLVMTIFLSLIAFALFGFADTLGAYEKETAAVSSVMDSGIKNASVRLGVKHTSTHPGQDPHSYYQYASMNDEDIEYLRKQTGLDFVPVFTGGDEWNSNSGFPFAQQFHTSMSNSEVYTGQFSGLVSMSDQQISKADLKLISGHMPSRSGQIVITELTLRQFNEYGFVNSEWGEEIAAGKVTKDNILHKHVVILPRGGMMSEDAPCLEIVGVLDTGFDYDRYAALLPQDASSTQNTGNDLGTMVLSNELRSELGYGFHMLGYVYSTDIEKIAQRYSANLGQIGTYLNGFETSVSLMIALPEGEVNDALINSNLIGATFNQIADRSALSKLPIKYFDESKKSLAKDELLISYYMYESFLSNARYEIDNEYWDVELSEEERQALAEVRAIELLQSSPILINFIERNNENGVETTLNSYSMKIVGYYENYSDLLISDELLADYKDWYAKAAENSEWGYVETVADHADGIWGFAIAPMGDEDALRKLVQMTYDEESDLNFSLQNSVMNTLESFNSFIEVGAQIFLYIGIGFAVFSALLLMNFISTSISYKKREIGILRAVGARSSDVFKIFFSEALIIALINFVLALAATVAGIIITNNAMRSQGINITLLTFGVRQVVLMLLISIVVALVASFLPVYRIAKRKPVDAIKDR